MIPSSSCPPWPPDNYWPPLPESAKPKPLLHHSLGHDPAVHLADDGIGVGGPHEGFGIVIGLAQEAVDGGLQIGDALKTPRCSRRRVSLAKKPSTALSQEAEVGVKWK